MVSRKYLAGKCCVHSEEGLYDPGKIRVCRGQNKEPRLKQGTSAHPPAGNLAAKLGRESLKGVILFCEPEDYS